MFAHGYLKHFKRTVRELTRAAGWRRRRGSVIWIDRVSDEISVGDPKLLAFLRAMTPVELESLVATESIDWTEDEDPRTRYAMERKIGHFESQVGKIIVP